MTKQSFVGVLVAIIVVVLSNSLYVIRETQRGVLLKFGEVVDPDLRPGLHLKIPFVNSVRKFDGRILTVDSSPERFFTQEKKALIVQKPRTQKQKERKAIIEGWRVPGLQEALNPPRRSLVLGLGLGLGPGPELA